MRPRAGGDDDRLRAGQSWKRHQVRMLWLSRQDVIGAGQVIHASRSMDGQRDRVGTGLIIGMDVICTGRARLPIAILPGTGYDIRQAVDVE